MDTREAIKFLKEFAKHADNDWDMPVLLSDGDKARNIISLLEQGEKATEGNIILKEENKKLWKMWEDLPDLLEPGFHNWDLTVVVRAMINLEQKYFPKGEGDE
ncbi:MAG: hypothetical protein WD512_01005 [Candidatus Paceibacterota bacterium]